MEGAEWECETCSADNYACNCYLSEIKEAHDTQSDRITALEAENKALRKGIQNVLEQKEPKDDKWVIGYLTQLLTPAQEK